jgi:hypothetical protein
LAKQLALLADLRLQREQLTLHLVDGTSQQRDLVTFLRRHPVTPTPLPMHHVIHKDLRLLVPHRIERTDRPANITTKVVLYVGDNLGSSGVDVVPKRKHQPEHAAEGGTIL